MPFVRVLLTGQTTHRAIQVNRPQKPLPELTQNVHSSHDLNWLEAQRIRVKLTDLRIPTIALVIVFDLLEAENLKSKDLADEYPT